MARLSRQLPSPSPSVVDLEDSAAPYRKSTNSGGKMLNIQALLNPFVSSGLEVRSNAGSASPSRSQTSTPTTTSFVTSRPTTPATTTSSKQKQIDGPPARTNRDTGGSGVNYPPFERVENVLDLSPTQQQELRGQHKLFQVLPYSEKEEDLIAGFTRHIPYSSDKKSFGGKTGKNGFNVFQYSFRVPGDSTKYAVMWDYDHGLVRITPFFKACNYTKTTPAKALNTNAGLKDLAHSITGGALDAQGYWMPYYCARALCTTFCYDIRWAMTPIFGPSFIHDCLKRDDPRFGKFKIDPEIVRAAQVEVDGWKTPTVNGTGEGVIIPRSVPEEVTSGKELRPRAARPVFKVDSPFSSDFETTYPYDASPIDSPEISPKTTYSSPVWTSINRPQAPKTANTTPLGSLQNSLLNESRYTSWRPAVVEGAANHQRDKNHPGNATTSNKSTGLQDKRNASKCQHSSSKVKKHHPKVDYASSRSGYDAERSESESDDTDIVVHPTPKKRARHLRKASVTSTSTTTTSKNTKGKGKSRKYHAEDYRAAQWLLNLSMRDADLATGPNGPVNIKTK